MHPLGFYYNKAVMEKAGLDPEKPPTTADEYMSALDTLKGKGIEGHWATPFPFTGSMTVQSLLWQFGGDLFSEDATAVTWADEPGVKAMTWFADLVKNGHSPGKIAQDADIVAFQNSKTAFNWNGIWQINTLKEKARSSGAWPALPNIGGTDAAWAGSHQFVLPTLKTPDENKSQRRPGVPQLDQPAVAGVGEGRSGARPATRSASRRSSRRSRTRPRSAPRSTYVHFPPSVPGIGDAYLEWEKALNESVLGIKEPQAALSDAAGRANKILEANKKKYGG